MKHYRLVGLVSLLLLLPVLSTLQGCAIVDSGSGNATTRQTDDRTLRLIALSKLDSEPSLQQDTHIDVIAVNGQLVLVGQARSQALSQRAEQLVNQLDGVKQLHNQIRLQTPTALSTRSYDSWLTAKIKSKLMAERDIEGSRVKVVTENSEVFLLGLVTRQEADLAVEITRNTGGVKRVIKVFEYL